MKRRLLAFISAGLVGIVGLTFAYPAAMLAPGPLIPAHTALSNDCFACHAPLQGAVAARCTTCHAISDIGLKTVAGAPVTHPTTMVPFHQGLADADCMGCHTDHPPPSLTPPHSHSFAHAMLTPAVGAACSACHSAPKNVLHAGSTAQCSTCHSQSDWASAAIDHAGFFALTGPHDVACATCHTTANDFGKFTCFGCHSHQEADLIAEHLEEGIRSIDNCVACHRGADAEVGEGGEGDDD